MAIGKYFIKLVEKDDYAKNDKDTIIKYMCQLTNDNKKGSTVNLSQ